MLGIWLVVWLGALVLTLTALAAAQDLRGRSPRGWAAFQLRLSGSSTAPGRPPWRALRVHWRRQREPYTAWQVLRDQVQRGDLGGVTDGADGGRPR
jgi:hypothetical protein